MSIPQYSPDAFQPYSQAEIRHELQKTAVYLADRQVRVAFEFLMPACVGSCGYSPNMDLYISLDLRRPIGLIFGTFLHEAAHARFKDLELDDGEAAARNQGGYWGTCIGILSKEDLPKDSHEFMSCLEKLRSPGVKDKIIPLVFADGVYHVNSYKRGEL